MDLRLRLLALAAAAALSACGGGSIAGGAAPHTPAVSWSAVLRFEPTDIHVSLRAAAMPFMYVDAGALNGAYPAADAFRTQIESANPGITNGACAAVTRMTTGVMEFTDAHGVQAPSYVIMFQPTAVGTCTQRIDLGADGVHSFSVTVTP